MPFDPTKSKHESVVFLLKHGNLDQQKLGSRLDALRIDRNKADYEAVIVGNLAKLAQASLKRAQEIIDGIGKLK